MAAMTPKEDKIITLNKSSFSKMVEKYVSEHKQSYMDSIVDLCEKMSIDFEDAGKFISPIVKGKLEAEVSQKNLLRENISVLPF